MIDGLFAFCRVALLLAVAVLASFPNLIYLNLSLFKARSAQLLKSRAPVSANDGL